jgi:hypothetical protein
MAAPPPPPPAPVYGAPTYGAPVAAKPPRPVVTAGAGLMVGGALLGVIGSFLTWFTLEGETYNGFGGTGADDVRDGPVFVFLAVVVGGLGIAMLAARRNLAMAIIGVVFAAFAVLAALADLGDVSDLKDLADAFGADFSTGPGLYLVLVGGLIGLAGSIAALAKRRR